METVLWGILAYNLFQRLVFRGCTQPNRHCEENARAKPWLLAPGKKPTAPRSCLGKPEGTMLGAALGIETSEL